MNTTNQKIFDFLHYYCELPAPPEYAVLIKGQWGSGKTWFINQFCKDAQDKNIKTLHISLYGMSSFEDIEKEFFRLLHPALSHPKMMLAGKVLKGVLKTTLKIDLNHDGKEDGSISSAIPDIELPEYLNDTENFVLIFDDLERCGIPITNLLGYINHFVEYSGQKVILIANEDEIIRANDSNPENIVYGRIKEKLIGKTFEIQPEVNPALDNFIDGISKVNRELLKNHQPTIIELYTASKYKNLRHLKQALSDFDRLVDCIPEQGKSNNDLVETLLRNFLIFSFEIKSGSLKPSEISQLDSGDWIIFFMEKKYESDPNHPFSKIGAKYPAFNNYNLVLTGELWAQIFDQGIFDAELAQEQIKGSKYLFSENTPAWQRLWYAQELDDDEIIMLLEVVSTEFEQVTHKELEVFLHIFGILLCLSELEIYSLSKVEIVEKGKAYINTLKKESWLAQQAKALNHPFFHESSYHLGYHEKESDEFKEIRNYLDEKCQEAIRENYPENAKALLNLMQTDIFRFSQHLQLSNHEDNLYYKIPILSYMVKEAFVACFVELPQRSKWTVTSTLEKRYAFTEFNKELSGEIEWLADIGDALKVEANNSPKMKKANLLNASEAFQKAAEHLKQFR